MSGASDVRYLVVNADDFGLTPGICSGILRAHREGVVTSTSVLVNAPAFAANVGRLRDSGLPAGLHLCFVGEDPPLLSAPEVPTLVGPDGRFPLTWKQFVSRAARGRVDPDDLRREATAQLEALIAEGVDPTHVDSHQNLHLWPSVRDVAIELAAHRRVRVLRVTGTRRVTPVGLGVRVLGRATRRRATTAGLVTPDLAMGLDEAGSMSPDRLLATIRTLSRSTGHADLTVHPGADPDPDRARYAWGYAWGQELEAVTQPLLTERIRRLGFTLGSFADLATAR